MDELTQSAAAIRQIESGGNYSALGPVVTRGRYAGDRAYGAYQVMGKNIPQWTREVLGREMTPAQFLADSAAQDRVFMSKFGQAAQRHGSLVDAASVWHSGRPLAQARAAGATDGYSTTVQYTDRFASIIQGQTPLSPRAAQGYATGINAAELNGTAPDANAPMTAMQMKQEDAYAGLARLAELRQVAEQGTKFGSGFQGNPSTPQQVRPQSKAASTPLLQSKVTAF